ncbi:hypothetical protein [[Pseudomonas] boreopolis]|uniref:Uncharacterized protein n=1 Tax=Xanthomonas boreopolis TaxID=86183 RepID=A0A919KHJ1_9XANT|nr:hypothetical protein GCM10009090_16700 [[Pseudomonas] boreopolis]
MMFNGACVAHVTPGRIWLSWRGHQVATAHRGSVQQGMRFSERWIAAKGGFPSARKGMFRDTSRKAAAMIEMQRLIHQPSAPVESIGTREARARRAELETLLAAMENFPR